MSRYSHSKVAAGEINNTHIADDAAVAFSKINSTGKIVNADIAANAAIEMSKTSGNPANVLTGLTPTFAGWDTNPGTTADMTNELNSPTLTTAGAITNPSTITWDLTTSERRLISFSFTPTASIQISDDNVTYYTVTTSTGTTRACKFRYLRYSRSTTGAVTEINIRVYRL